MQGQKCVIAATFYSVVVIGPVLCERIVKTVGFPKLDGGYFVVEAPFAVGIVFHKEDAERGCIEGACPHLYVYFSAASREVEYGRVEFAVYTRRCHKVVQSDAVGGIAYHAACPVGPVQIFVERYCRRFSHGHLVGIDVLIGRVEEVLVEKIVAFGGLCRMS